jgi:uncharacterized membrane-anchored protein YjiN (DUF445 family)
VPGPVEPSAGNGPLWQPPLPQLRDEAEKRAALMRMKRVALGFLGAAAVGFLVCRYLLPHTFLVGLLEAFFEASMVGALADWFAVTALFRHPLGLPIPHTAIIPERKARLANSLANFVGSQFLTPENVLPRLERINFAELAGRWLETPGHVRGLRTRIVGAIEGAMEGLSDTRIREFSDREVIPRLKEVALAPRLSDLLLGLARDGQHEELLDEVLRGAASVAASNRDAIFDVVRAQMPSLVPSFVVDVVTDAVMGKIDTTIQGMLDDRAHPLRLRIHERVQEFLERLDHDPEMQAKVDALRDRVLENPALRDFAVERWGDFKAFLVRDLHDESSAIFGFLEQRGAELGRSMLEDEAFQRAVNEKVAETAAWAVREHGQRIPDLIRDTVERWPAEAVSDRIEVAVGKDLQWIRINGTLVGGLVGALLYLLTAWLG